MRTAFILTIGALAAQASAGFIAGPFSGNSGGTVGSPDNTIVSYNHVGANFTAGDFILEGDLSEAATTTFANEARIRIRNPGGGAYNTPALTTLEDYFGAIHIGPTMVASSGLTGTSVGMWTFEMFDSFDDQAGPDSLWNNLVIQALDAAPPPPVFPGDFTTTPNILGLNAPQDGTTLWSGLPGQPGLTDGAGESAHGTRYGGLFFDHLGNEVAYQIDHAGGDLILELINLNSNLDLMLVDSTGLPANTLMSSTTFAEERIEAPGAAPGRYYAVVDTFGSSNPGSTFTIVYTPEPSGALLLGLAALGWMRRRR